MQGALGYLKDMGTDNILGTLRKGNARTFASLAVGTVVLHQAYGRFFQGERVQDRIIAGERVDAIVGDRGLDRSFERLQKVTSENNRPLLAKAVVEVDRLVYMYQAMQDKSIVAVPEDRANGFLLYKKSQTYLKRLELATMVQQVPPKAAVVTEVTVRNIISRIQEYCVAIMRCTNRLYT